MSLAVTMGIVHCLRYFGFRHSHGVLHLMLQNSDFPLTLTIAFQKVLNLLNHFSTHSNFLSFVDIWISLCGCVCQQRAAVMAEECWSDLSDFFANVRYIGVILAAA